MNKPREKLNLPATDSTPKPGDFPLGSIKSRAATRAMIVRSAGTGIRVKFIMGGHPPKDCKGNWCLQLSNARDGSTVPDACGLVTGRLFVNGEGQVELRDRGEEPFRLGGIDGKDYF